MAIQFNQVKSDAFSTLQFGAGNLLNDTFELDDGALPSSIPDSMIISSTKSGIKASCVPTFTDLGEDIDNCPKNTKELKQLDSWEAKFEATLMEMSATTAKLAFGCADETGGVVTPRAEVAQTDFATVWWIGKTLDGKYALIELINALSDGGFSFQSTDKSKGELAVSLVGHTTVTDESLVPMRFYIEVESED